MSDYGNEAARLHALADYRLLDGASDPRMDALVTEAATRFAAPMATVTLIDRDRQWFRARVGVAADETPLSESICNVAMREPDGLVVPDASLDYRFAGMECVAGEANIRFYAGAPLTLRNGVRVGTMCVIDTVPRDDFDEADRALLAQMAARAVAEFELERDWRREGRAAPGSDAEWLRAAASLLTRASAALEQVGATAAVARLEEVIAEVDGMAGTEAV